MAEIAEAETGESKKQGVTKVPDREELKNCPFCGGDADAIIILRKQNPNRYFVVCNRCYGRTGEKETKDEAVSAWNRRDSEKKGHWKYASKNLMACSVCGNCIMTERISDTFVCPCCGAKLIEETE